MKTLHRYLLRQVLATLLMTLLVFTFILLLADGLKEILPLLLKQQVGVLKVLEAILLLVPWMLMFALPMGMLTATLLVFGRFSADQELTAARASGISLLSLAAPVLALSLVCCGLSAWVNLQLAPQCRVAFKNLLIDIGWNQPSLYLPENQYVTDFPGATIYVGKNNGKEIKDVMVYLIQGGSNIVMQLNAPRGDFQVDRTNRSLEIRLFDVRSVTLTEGRLNWQSWGEWSQQFDLAQATKAAAKPRISDMTYTQLREELRRLESQVMSGGEGTETNTDLKWRRAEILSPVRVQLHQNIAFSFACFGFALVGIPLAIRVHRRETNIGMVIALLLVGVYYSFLILGGALETHPRLYPHLIMWVPNFLFQGLGAVLLWRANRGT
ncbi:MAG TPA: LptF/LptG family permease [Dongiaceae bacterium]|nr:LptF/LptG family permease [Dongiaceae bacterium]